MATITNQHRKDAAALTTPENETPEQAARRIYRAAMHAADAAADEAARAAGREAINEILGAELIAAVEKRGEKFAAQLQDALGKIGAAEANTAQDTGAEAAAQDAAAIQDALGKIRAAEAGTAQDAAATMGEMEKDAHRIRRSVMHTVQKAATPEQLNAGGEEGAQAIARWALAVERTLDAEMDALREQKGEQYAKAVGSVIIRLNAAEVENISAAQDAAAQDTGTAANAAGGRPRRQGQKHQNHRNKRRSV